MVKRRGPSESLGSVTHPRTMSPDLGLRLACLLGGVSLFWVPTKSRTALPIQSPGDGAVPQNLCHPSDWQGTLDGGWMG